jgi:hypothetical protein
MQTVLTCDGKQVHAFSRPQGTYESLHSHRPLEKMEVTFDTLNREQMDWAKDYGNVHGVAEWAGKKWQIGTASYSYEAGSPIARFTWELREIEDLQVTEILLNGWSLTPYKYKEELDGDALIAEGRVELTPDEYERLLLLPKYFSVVRRGIEDEPREMRFGRYLWSKSEDKYKVQLYLVEKRFDDTRSGHGFLEPQSSNDADSIVYSAILLDRLMDSLIHKGVLSAQECEKLKNIDDELQMERERAKRNRVDDLDEWLDKEE